MNYPKHKTAVFTKKTVGTAMKAIVCFLWTFLILTQTASSAKICNCYLNIDCGPILACHVGVDCREVGSHASKPDSPDFGAISNIGLCKVFGPLEPGDPDNPVIFPPPRDLWATAVNNFLFAFERTGASTGGAPDVKQFAKALASDLSPESQSSIRSLVRHIAALTLGPAPGENLNMPHRTGYYSRPGRQAYYKTFGELFAVKELGSVNPIDPATLAAAAYVRKAVVVEIRNPGNGLFGRQMMTLLKNVPNYKTFGACEHPHPPEHGHEFGFKDGVDCLNKQIARALNLFNGIGVRKTKPQK